MYGVINAFRAEWDVDAMWVDYCLQHHFIPEAGLFIRKLNEYPGDVRRLTTILLGNAVQAGDCESIAVLMMYCADPYAAQDGGRNSLELLSERAKNLSSSLQRLYFTGVLLNKDHVPLRPEFAAHLSYDLGTGPITGPNGALPERVAVKAREEVINRDYETALTYAILSRYVHCVDWLLNGLHVSALVRNGDGQPPLEIALEMMPYREHWGAADYRKGMVIWRQIVGWLVQHGGLAAKETWSSTRIPWDVELQRIMERT
jgi:hypothetical protein